MPRGEVPSASAAMAVLGRDWRSRCWGTAGPNQCTSRLPVGGGGEPPGAASHVSAPALPKGQRAPPAQRAPLVPLFRVCGERSCGS